MPAPTGTTPTSAPGHRLALGLAGVLIVEEDNPPAVDQDLVFAIDDWRLDDDMQIDRKSLGSMHDWAHAGRMGNVITVNGQTEKVFHGRAR